MAGKWGVSLPPAVTPGGLTGAVNGGTYLSVPSSSKNQQTAWAFIDFALGTVEGQKLVYDGGGMFPGFTPMLESEGFVAPSKYFGGQKVNQVFIDELQPGHSRGELHERLRAGAEGLRRRADARRPQGSRPEDGTG